VPARALPRSRRSGGRRWPPLLAECRRGRTGSGRQGHQYLGLTIEVDAAVDDKARVAFRGNCYSVPPGLGGVELTLRHRLGKASLEIFSPAGLQLVSRRLSRSGSGGGRHGVHAGARVLVSRLAPSEIRQLLGMLALREWRFSRGSAVGTSTKVVGEPRLRPRTEPGTTRRDACC
jgi:hypothetical protein